MKKTRRKSVLRGIRGSINRFLSILFIVAIGAGFLAGLEATTPDMQEAADKYMDDACFFDLDIKGTQGVTAEDAEALAALPFAASVQAAKVTDAVLNTSGGHTYTSRIFGTLDERCETKLNALTLLSGRMPENVNECVIQAPSGYAQSAPEIGEKLTFSPENEGYDKLSDTYSVSELEIVGIVQSPMFISVETEPSAVGSGAITLAVYGQEQLYSLSVYTDLYLTLDGAEKLNTFSDEYRALEDSATAELEPFGTERAKLRTESLKAEANEKIDSAKSLLASLESAEGAAKALYTDDAKRLSQSVSVIMALSRTGSPEAKALAAQLQTTALSVKETVSGKAQEADSASDRFQPMRDEISDAEDSLTDIEDGEWIIRTRRDLVGYSSYTGNVEKVAALCKVFPVFFFLVAMLVALTTMTRLVEEKRTEIGTLKALGFTDFQVLSEYLIYSLSASLLGCALGFAVGFRIFPAVISNAYGMMYHLPAVSTPIRPEIVLTVAPITIGGILLATWAACFGITRSCPAQLMVPKAPKAGKRILLERIPFIWKRMSFIRKVTARNIFRYKKRLFMTVVGVAGCSALLVTGFGLRDSINDIVDKQFGEIYKYNLTLAVDSESGFRGDEALSALLSDDSVIRASMPIMQESGRALLDGNSQSVNIAVAEDSVRLPQFITLRERKSGAAIQSGGSGVILTEKLAEQLGAKKGSTVTLESASGKRAKIAVDGVTENYVAAFAYMSPEAYERAFGEKPEYKSIICTLADDGKANDIVTRAIACKSIIYARTSVSIMETFSDSVKSIDYIVIVLILAAGMLSMVVLFNLTNVNVCERRKELATIRVLGFYRQETQRYIFRETNILSLIGTAFGMLLGVWLHSFVVRTVEVNAVMFGRTIYPLSFVYALAISLFFTLIVNQIMKKSIDSIDMVESMKAND